MAKSKVKQTKKSYGFVVPVIVICVLVLAVSVMFLTRTKVAGGLDGLPNYTEIRGDFDANGLKYEKQPHLGSTTAKAKVIEFADFKCPACKKWKETYFEQFKQEFMSKLYDHQGDETKIWATPQFMLDFVKDNISGIDYERFAKDLQAHTYMLPVKEDFKTAGNYGVNGTPKFMVNGQLLPGSSYEELAAAIEAAQASNVTE